MDNSALNQEATELARREDQARTEVQRTEWQMALRALTEAQDRIGHRQGHRYCPPSCEAHNGRPLNMHAD